MMAVVYTSVVGCCVTILIADPKTGVQGWFGLFMTLPVFVISAILVVPILRNRSQGSCR